MKNKKETIEGLLREYNAVGVIIEGGEMIFVGTKRWEQIKNTKLQSKSNKLK